MLWYWPSGARAEVYASTYWWLSSSAMRAVAASRSALSCTTSVRPPLSSVISRSAYGLTRVLMGSASGGSIAIA
jgi:hypothetical protein